MVEGALVFGIFMTIVLAIIEFGLFFMFWSSGRNASSEAAHEAALAGRSGGADYSALYSIRNQITQLKSRADYVIVYRAKGIKNTVPAQCIAAAEAGKGNTDPGKAVGVFIDDVGGTNVETYAWEDKTKRPQVACNVYYSRTLDYIPGAKERFVYNVQQAENGNASLDRFWPGQRRRDWINGPVDFVGIYVQTQYNSATGIVPSRKVKHNSIIQIEPRSTN
jgi:Flp pilus assembly protein TadG